MVLGCTIECKEYDEYIKWEKIYSSYNEIRDKGDLPDWFKNYMSHIGEKYKDYRGKEVTLIGMSETDEDYYYVLEDSNGEKLFESCVGPLKGI